MRKYFFMISMYLLSVAILSPIQSHAAAPDLRVAYVDLQKALSESKAGSSAQKQYETEVKSAQKQLDGKKSELERFQKEFSKQRDSLSATARTEREEKLIEMERDLKRSFEDSQEKLRRKNVKLVGELLKKLRKTVSSVGQQEGYTIILEKGAQAVLYADNEIDITDMVIKEFDKN